MLVIIAIIATLVIVAPIHGLFLVKLSRRQMMPRLVMPMKEPEK